MLYREIIAVCSQIHTEHINTLCGQNMQFVNVKLVVHVVTTGPERDIFGTRIQCPVPSDKDRDLNGHPLDCMLLLDTRMDVCFLNIPSCDNCGCPLAPRVDFSSFFYLFCVLEFVLKERQ
jgi:hypothetical protein